MYYDGLLPSHIASSVSKDFPVSLQIFNENVVKKQTNRKGIISNKFLI